jgi:hypothetical protein
MYAPLECGIHNQKLRKGNTNKHTTYERERERGERGNSIERGHALLVIGQAIASLASSTQQHNTKQHNTKHTTQHNAITMS